MKIEINLTEQEVQEFLSFLKYTSLIDTEIEEEDGSIRIEQVPNPESPEVFLNRKFDEYKNEWKISEKKKLVKQIIDSSDEITLNGILNK